MTRTFTLHFDGASKGNPGPAGIGGVILDDQGKTHEVKKAIGVATNNQAEYTALIETLKQSRTLGGEVLHVFSDSELVVRQLNGIYRVKDLKLIPLYKEAVALARSFQKVTFRHVPREENKEADALANQAVAGARSSADFSVREVNVESAALLRALTSLLDDLSGDFSSSIEMIADELDKKDSRSVRVRCDSRSLSVNW